MTARPVPGYLGQILDGGVPVGTCFQVAPGVVVTAWHVRPGLAEAVNEARRARLLAEAAQACQPVRLGVAAAPELAWLPWEALPRPDGRGPLALHPLVRVYRRASAADPRLVPGPLRIVVAIAAPLDSGGGVVDYERHLRSVIAEVRSARQDDADVRGIPFAVLSAIREELQRAPAHVLHVYCHGSPGRLELEDQDGNARLAGAEEFLAEAIPPGAMPPVITLSACYTDAAAAACLPCAASWASRRIPACWRRWSTTPSWQK